MTIFLDIAGSWIVRATMITMMLGLQLTMNDALYKTSQQARANATLEETSEIVYTDVNLAGYNASWPCFDITTSNNMRFYGDLNNGGLCETIRYYTSLDAATGLYKLYRYVDRENGGVATLLGKDFKSVTFLYYDYRGVLTTNYSDVMSVRIKLVAQIPGATSGFTTALSDFKVYPPNL